MLAATYHHIDLALLIARVFFGVALAYHGYRKFAGKGGIDGTAGWFRSIGMRWAGLQARAAAGTEIGAGLLLAAGLLTPFAGAGVIGVMIVAGYSVHRKTFLVLEQGWELTAAYAVAALTIAAIGPGEWSLDHAFGIEWTGWTGFLIAALLGVGAGVAQLAVCYRPADATT